MSACQTPKIVIICGHLFFGSGSFVFWGEYRGKRSLKEKRGYVLPLVVLLEVLFS